MRNPQKNHFCGMQSKQNWLSGYPGKPPISSYAGTQAVSQRHQRLAMFALWWNYIYNYIYIYKYMLAVKPPRTFLLFVIRVIYQLDPIGVQEMYIFAINYAQFT